MRTLALDTSTAAGSVAWRRDGRTIASREGDPSRPHATRLPRALMELLVDDGATLNDVELLAVGLGPGAFTGLRVGLATMQGLAFATGHPIVGVSGLDALAVAARRASGDVAIGVWIDAARHEVFAARYLADETAPLGVVLLEAPIAAKPASVLRAWRESAKPMPAVWIGSGASIYGDTIGIDPAERGSVVTTPVLAPLIAELGEELARRGDIVAPHALRPLYVRRPDAELARAQSVPLEEKP